MYCGTAGDLHIRLYDNDEIETGDTSYFGTLILHAYPFQCKQAFTDSGQRLCLRCMHEVPACTVARQVICTLVCMTLLALRQATRHILVDLYCTPSPEKGVFCCVFATKHAIFWYTYTACYVLRRAFYAVCPGSSMKLQGLPQCSSSALIRFLYPGILPATTQGDCLLFCISN